MLSWARQRARLDPDALSKRFPKLEEWEAGETAPTLKQLEGFAAATHVPIGYLFLDQPPVENLPIPDFRTIRNTGMGRPSPDLLDMLYVCQQRQEWYRDYAHSLGETPLPFVGSASVGDEVVEIADSIRDTLGFDLEERRQMPTWTDALRRFIGQADEIGILVMCSGVVLNNNYRKLNPREVRGFAMADPLAPLVFINGADTKAAQMFTLAHELAHIWAGQSAVSDEDASGFPDHDAERWCNAVAAEVLVPLDAILDAAPVVAGLETQMTEVARRFKVSTLVALRRFLDAGLLNRGRFEAAYADELARLLAIERRSGGNFYLTQAARVSRRFARSLVISTLEGQTLHRDALRMLGFSKLSTFDELGRSVGVAV